MYEIEAPTLQRYSRYMEKYSLSKVKTLEEFLMLDDKVSWYVIFDR